MEIERKFLVKALPENLESYESHHIAQGYLNTDPVVRIRKADDDYYLTYKGKGLMVREEYNLPLNAKSFEHMVAKIDGILIQKRRYLIPLGEGYGDGKHVAELDIFEGVLTPLRLVEVEFESEEDALAFIAPDWFGDDVTNSTDYHNSTLSKRKL